jgi:hypothetical protein
MACPSAAQLPDSLALVGGVAPGTRAPYGIGFVLDQHEAAIQVTLPTRPDTTWWAVRRVWCADRSARSGREAAVAKFAGDMVAELAQKDFTIGLVLGSPVAPVIRVIGRSISASSPDPATPHLLARRAGSAPEPVVLWDGCAAARGRLAVRPSAGSGCSLRLVPTAASRDSVERLRALWRVADSVSAAEAIVEARERARADSLAREAAARIAEAREKEEARARAEDAREQARSIAARKAAWRRQGWSERQISLVLDRRVAIGMSKAMVRAAWGEPDDINTMITGYGRDEQWVYRRGDFRGQYVYFENGRVTAMQSG